MKENTKDKREEWFLHQQFLRTTTKLKKYCNPEFKKVSPTTSGKAAFDSKLNNIRGISIIPAIRGIAITAPTYAMRRKTSSLRIWPSLSIPLLTPFNFRSAALSKEMLSTIFPGVYRCKPWV